VIAVDGIPVPGREGLAYYLVNKPVGVICTASDPQGRPTVTALGPGRAPGLPGGEAGHFVEGLIVLTNDGDLAYKLTHPSFGVLKEYVVEVEGTLFARRAWPATPGRAPRRRDDGAGQGFRTGPSSARVTIHKGATARSDVCASPSATRCAGWSAPG